MSATSAWSMVIRYIRRQRGAVKAADPRAHRAVMLCGGYERCDRRRGQIRPLFLQLYRLLTTLEEIP